MSRIFKCPGLCLVFTTIFFAKAFSQSEASDLVKDLWYKNALIYSLEVGTFKDSDGDGIGDFEGLTQKLDYLKALGIDVIWLAPFQPSPRKDDGYDVSDYYGIDPQYGTGGDFAEFIYQADRRGIKVMMDIVINHTSDQHPWFKSARADKKSRYRSWYVWSKKKPAMQYKGMVFPGVQKETWTYDKKTGEYYYHRFYEFQPDLNYQNPEVQKEGLKVIGYWLNQGVAGFRLDAVPFILEVPDPDRDSTTHQFEILMDIRRFVQWRKNDAIILGEANVLPDESKDYFGEKGDGMHTMFNFYVNQHVFYALATGEIQPLRKAMKDTRDIPEMAQWAQFLRNHDEVDLGRLTDEQRNRIYEAMGPSKNMQLYNRGIRRRLAPMLGNLQQVKMAYSLIFSLPGTPVIRYGDEIGMGDDLSLTERLAVRTPMQWSPERNAGFSSAEKTFRPVIDTGAYSYKRINVESQRKDSNSLLNFMTEIIRLRKECPEIGAGNWKIIDSSSANVLVMQYDYKDQSLIVLHNFSKEPKQIYINTNGSNKLSDLLGNDDKNVSQGKFDIRLEGYGYKWYRRN